MWPDTINAFYDRDFHNHERNQDLDVPDLRLDLRRIHGSPEHGLAPGTAWADVPMNWTCPECGARKEDFELVQI